jgi:hypothetical protein
MGMHRNVSLCYKEKGFPKSQRNTYVLLKQAGEKNPESPYHLASMLGKSIGLDKELGRAIMTSSGWTSQTSMAAKKPCGYIAAGAHDVGRDSGFQRGMRTSAPVPFAGTVCPVSCQNVPAVITL